MIENGRDLIEVKETLGDGHFAAWLRQVFPFTEQTAYRWINAVKMYGDRTNIMLALNDTVLQLLAAPSMPDEVREGIEARALAGKKITVAEVQELKREAARAKEQAEQLEIERDEWIRAAREARERTLHDRTKAANVVVHVHDGIDPAARVVTHVGGWHALISAGCVRLRLSDTCRTGTR